MLEQHALDAVLWLPDWPAVAGAAEEGLPQLRRMLCQGDHQAPVAEWNTWVPSHFDILPRGLPVAALTCALDGQEPLNFTWLRADPGHVVPDMVSARLMACGQMDLSADECEALLEQLRPLFGDEGFLISAPVPSRWYLCLPAEARLPEFHPPADVLGDDLFEHLPEGDLGRRWRRLLNEVQVILHNHPINEARKRAGKITVNTLWFWGGGRMPDHVRSTLAQVRSGDALLEALAKQAGVEFSTDTDAGSVPPGGLVDLHRVHDVALLESHWIGPLRERVRRGELPGLRLQFADGHALRWRAGHRRRFWRRRIPG